MGIPDHHGHGAPAAELHKLAEIVAFGIEPGRPCVAAIVWGDGASEPRTLAGATPCRLDLSATETLAIFVSLTIWPPEHTAGAELDVGQGNDGLNPSTAEASPCPARATRASAPLKSAFPGNQSDPAPLIVHEKCISLAPQSAFARPAIPGYQAHYAGT